LKTTDSVKLIRPRRLRKNSAVRSAVQETFLTSSHLVQPLFISKKTEAIASMPGQYRLSLKDFESKITELKNLGLFGVSLFSHVEDKDKDSKASFALKDTLYFEAIDCVKRLAPELQVITDVALDPYSSDGHDGLVSKTGEILNDETCKLLAEMSLIHAKLGADFIAPSDMMDGRVFEIREALELNDYKNVGIISYTAKYASSLYGPFRDALDSAPKAGDKKTYQMDFANSEEAVREALLDAEEGADFLMVKPAGFYLDVINRLTQLGLAPVAAYQVSGEYAALMAAFEKGWLSQDKVIHESLMAIRRAGASLIFTYFAESWANQNNLKK
jgi:porphobilinogen synthase